MVSPTKVAKTDAEPSNEFQESIEKIDEIQNEIEKLNEQASEEILKIDQKFDKLRQPFYKKRCEHIAKIPNFWMTTLINHPQIAHIITDEDEEILKHLTEIEIQDMEDAKTGFRINFHFEPNPFFENSVLTREIYLTDSQIKPVVCEIKWKEGMNPATRKSTKAGRKRGLTDSFFCWFTCSGENDEGEGMVIDEVGELIKEEIYANPLQFLLETEGDGEDEADEDEAGSGEEEESGEEDGDDDDDDVE